MISFDDSITVASNRNDAGRDKQAADVKRVASQFEALLLAQLTAKLNPASEDEDADLFRSDASDTFRTMFSEQLAQEIAGQGGIGLADLIAAKMLPPTTRSSINPKAQSFAAASSSTETQLTATQSSLAVKPRALHSTASVTSSLVPPNVNAQRSFLPPKSLTKGNLAANDFKPQTLSYATFNRAVEAVRGVRAESVVVAAAANKNIRKNTAPREDAVIISEADVNAANSSDIAFEDAAAEYNDVKKDGFAAYIAALDKAIPLAPAANRKQAAVNTLTVSDKQASISETQTSSILNLTRPRRVNR